jgi:zinc transport system ATP-binding protein
VPQKLDIERDLPLTGLDLLRAKAKVSRVSRAEISRVLATINLATTDAARAIGTLSGGQFQRLLLAFALMGRPSVLLFDEPTAGVDEPGEEGFYELFRNLKREERLTVLFISHELNLVYRFADNVLCLSRRRAWLGPPVAILTPERLQEVYGTAMKFHVHDDSGT